MSRILLVLSGVFLSLTSMQNAWSIDCKQAKQRWEYRVCGDSELKKIDKQMNQIYQKCLEIEYHANLELTQKGWLASLSDLNFLKTDEDLSSKLADAYSSRIDLLDTFYFNAKRVHRIGPIIRANGIGYQWITDSLDSKRLLKYPLLLENNTFLHLNEVNTQLKELAQKYLDDVLETFHCSRYMDRYWDNVFHFSIETTKSNFFGLKISFSDCYCSCIYGADVKFHYLWDLETGEDIRNALDKPFIIKDIHAFWSDVAQFTHKDLATLEEENSCKYNFLNEYTPSFNFYEDAIEVSTLGISGAERLCANAYYIPYSKFKSFHVAVDKRFRKYLPRLIDSGLISKKIGNEILQDIKVK